MPDFIFALLAFVALLALLAFSLRWNWWRFPKKGIPVLMYHKVGPAPRESRQKSQWVSPERFDWQMAYLKKKGYEAVTFMDLKANRPLPAKAVIITFDDGYLNQHEYAYPILKKYGFKAVFYVVREGVGKENFWHDPRQEPRIPMMNLEQIKDLMSSGMEIGSHTMTHQRLASLPREAARREISESKQSLEKLLGEAVVSFAFPYGNGEDAPDIVEEVFKAGYAWVLGIHAGVFNPDGNTRRPLPRVFIRGDDTRLDFILHLRAGRSRV